MKKIILLLFLSAICIRVYPQNNYLDVVSFKNGGIVRGIIFEQVPFKSLKICTVNGDTLIFKTYEIEKLTREPFPKGGKQPEIRISLKKGYQGMIEVGGTGAEVSCFKISIINSYRLNPFLSIGLGTGIRNNHFIGSAFGFYNEIANNFSLPLYFDTRLNFINHRLTPFIGTDIGYSFDIWNKESMPGYNYLISKGMMFNCFAGLSYIVSGKLSANFGIGYEKQQSVVIPEIYPYIKNPPYSQGVSVSFGLTF
jgi:hypothetical protein